jgi:hypothetical protein
MKRRKLLGLAFPLAGIVLVLLFVLVGGASGGSSNHLYRWDIIHLSTLPPPTTTLPGGKASACAAPSCANMITLTGNGTFRSNPGHPQDVTGGGTWTTVGAGAGSGTYEVTGFVSFVLDASGFLPSPPFTDGVTGVAADARAGLAVLRIAYSDGDQGVLVISCDLPGGSPPTLFEGITASKGFVDYWNRVAPESSAPFGNRTAFHEVH